MQSSQNGKYPNLCSGTLVLKIDGENKIFEHDLCSGGSVGFTDDYSDSFIENGPWRISLPEDLEPLRTEIEECINANIPYGCCGGCL